jgi:tRNA (cmo5U34)-methyltransferase
MNEWATATHAGAYLERPDVAHRAEGEATLWELVPLRVDRVLDLGTGDGRLMARFRERRPQASGVALDFSPTMLDAARQRFLGQPEVEVIEHDLDDPLPALGRFDAVISSFAIHHCSDERKQTLYQEVFDLLEPGGLFANLEHVASPTPRLHTDFLEALHAPEDPSNQLAPVQTQLGWLRAIGFEDVDCFWKWRELALLAGRKP